MDIEEEYLEKIWTRINNGDDNRLMLSCDEQFSIMEILKEYHKEQLRIGGVHDTLPADELIKSLGEPEKPNEYILKTDNGVWWIEDRNIGNGEPLKQWLTDKPISGAFIASEWISVKDKLPKELQTVWACNNETKFVALACLTYSDGWLWAVSNGSIYSENGKIVSECELDDDYDFTHWIPLPELPSV